jgi:hypothetical protein
VNEKRHPISIKLLADRHLENLHRCPHQFYLRQVKKQQTYTWKQVVQHAVHQVIARYYRLPKAARSTTSILQLLNTHWRKDVRLFDSKGHYYEVLAIVTNHLVQTLLTDREAEAPVILFETMRTYSFELETEIGITFHVVQWTDSSFSIKRYVLEEEMDSFESYKHMAVLFCEQGLGRLPERVEILSLLSGRAKVWHPSYEDIRHALEYMKEAKRILADPENYKRAGVLNECVHCPFKDECGSEVDVRKKEWVM